VADAFRCATAAREHAEPLLATASQVRRWILVEQPGPWGSDALLDSRLPDGVGRALQRQARRLGARVLLIRRHGRAVQRSPLRRIVLVAVTGETVRWVEEHEVDAAADLLDLDWTPLAADQPLGGRPRHGPVYLVCTNGRHDRCCAEYGRPLAATLATVAGDAAWECSHFGGDRFAGNLVCLPHGLYFGHVDPAHARLLTDAYARGRIDLEHYRGRSCYPFVVQAAEHFVRARTGLLGVDDLRWQRWIEAGTREVMVEFAGPSGRRFQVTVGVSQEALGRVLSCRGTLAHPPRYRLLALDTLG
jgi:hypothetical protein